MGWCLLEVEMGLGCRWEEVAALPHGDASGLALGKRQRAAAVQAKERGVGDFAKSFSFVASGEKDCMISVPRLAGRSSAW